MCCREPKFRPKMRIGHLAIKLKMIDPRSPTRCCRHHYQGRHEIGTAADFAHKHRRRYDRLAAYLREIAAEMFGLFYDLK